MAEIYRIDVIDDAYDERAHLQFSARLKSFFFAWSHGEMPLGYCIFSSISFTSKVVSFSLLSQLNCMRTRERVRPIIKAPYNFNGSRRPLMFLILKALWDCSQFTTELLTWRWHFVCSWREKSSIADWWMVGDILWNRRLEMVICEANFHGELIWHLEIGQCFSNFLITWSDKNQPSFTS